LLTKMFDNKGYIIKMMYAFNAMGLMNQYSSKRYINTHLYEKKKIELWKKTKGLISVNKDGKNKRISINKLDEYLNQGWKKGSWYSKENGRVVSDETRNKLRQRTGKKHHNYGKKHSFESIKLMSDARLKKVQVTKDKINKLILKEELEIYLQDGWKEGYYRRKVKRTKKVWLENGKHELKVTIDKVDDFINNGYSIGRLKEFKNKIKNKIVITNEIEDKYIEKGESIPEGYRIGRKKGAVQSEETKRKISESKKGKKLSNEHIELLRKINSDRVAINNGIRSSYCYKWELEEKEKEGWTKGLIRDKKVWITNGKEDLLIKEDDLKNYPEYNRGRSNKNLTNNKFHKKQNPTRKLF
jgi:hypothetical protein